MKLSVATNWDDAVIHALDGLNQTNQNIGEIWGTLRIGAIGNARPTFLLPDVSLDQAKAHIDLAHEKGFEFCYLINAPHLNNLEFDPEGRHRLFEYLQTIVDLGVDTVTVSIPYLVQLVKKNFPQLQVKVSVIAMVDSLNKIHFYENLGADAITLDPNERNRDFDFLAQAIKQTKIKLELIASESCLYPCPYRPYHYNMTASASQEKTAARWYIDYCFIKCLTDTIDNPTQILKTRFIRPEDLHVYEEIGYNTFKIGLRPADTAWLTRCATAYSNRRYDGNLLDILSGPPGAPVDTRNVQMSPVDGMPIEQWEFMAQGFKQMATPPPIYIDNRALDGFLDGFRSHSCDVNCDNCSYCEQFAKQAIRILSNEGVNAYLWNLKTMEDVLLSKNLFFGKPMQEKS